MKKLFYALLIALVSFTSFTSCSTDDDFTPIDKECPQRVYETIYVAYDSQDNVSKFNDNPQNAWVQNQDLSNGNGWYDLVPANDYIAFRHFNGWGKLTMQTAQGYEIVSVVLLNHPKQYSGAHIFTSVSNINSDRYELEYENGQDYSDDGDVYYMVITLAYE